MGTAILDGLIAKGTPADHVAVSTKSLATANALNARLGVHAYSQELDPDANILAVDNADVVLVAVKPAYVLEVLGEVANTLKPSALLISVAAGITTAAMEGALPETVAVIRAMPNTPAIVGRAITGISAGSRTETRHLELATELFRAVGKTMVSSSIIDRVVSDLGRKLIEVPVGFKWFVPGLIDGSVGFGGEESAGASFLRRDGRVWSTDKDGLILALLASEITAVTGKTPTQRYAELTAKFGATAYERIDAAATIEQKSKLGKLSADDVTASELAGEPIKQILTHAPGNGAALGGLKVVTENAWFAARPSGTENVYKIYGESFKGAEHLKQVQVAAKELVDGVLG